MRLSRRTFLGAGAAAAGSAALRAQKKSGLKIFMLWDMEGTSGLFTREQLWYWEPGVRTQVVAEALEIFTANVNAATRAALEAGVTELIVCDTHHGGGNFLKDKLLQDPRVTYLYRSVGMENGKRRLMPGLNETVNGFFLMAHHAKAGTPNSFLPHAQSRDWMDFTINGMSVGEIGIETCFAGHWDVPLVYVQGDEAACYEARMQFPGVITTAVKRGGPNPDVCVGLDAESGRRETAKGIAEAVRALQTRKFQPYKPDLPMTVTLRVRTMDQAAALARKLRVPRLDDYTIEARVGSQADVVKWVTGAGLDMAEK